MSTESAARRFWPLVHLGLFLATVVTVFGAFLSNYAEPRTSEAIWGAVGFTAALISILGAHEMGHYLLARYHQVDTSLPYFIPAPFLPFGTLGAVIRIRAPIPNRNALVDIGAAGPLAGLVTALPILWVGMLRSRVVSLPVTDTPFPRDGSLWMLLHRLYDYLRGGGAQLPEPTTLVFGDNLLTLGLQHLVHGALGPGQTVMVDPVFLAGWFGLLVTMLNLIPIGQLDGGHLGYALLGARAPLLGKAVALVMGALCLFFTVGWLVWLLVTVFVIRFRHPPVTDEAAPLTRVRQLICVASALALVICFMPVPLDQLALP